MSERSELGLRPEDADRKWGIAHAGLRRSRERRTTTCVTRTTSANKTWPAFLGLVLVLATSGCSLRKMAVNTVAGALAESGDVFASDEDPELIRDAMPFALKTMETLLAEAPKNPGLLLSACQGFVLYGAGFVELEADRLEATSYRRAKVQHERALKLALRGRGYCFRALDRRLPGAREALVRAPGEALAKARREHVPLLYWTAAAWGSAIAGGQDRPELVADLPAVRALLERALELDPGWDRGALHDAMMLLEFAEVQSGAGSIERARTHYERSLELSGGTRAGTYVGWASTVSVQEQDRGEFERLLERALAIDPDREPGERLANLIQQDRARWLLGQADELFLGDLDELDDLDDLDEAGDAEDPPGSSGTDPPDLSGP